LSVCLSVFFGFFFLKTFGCWLTTFIIGAATKSAGMRVHGIVGEQDLKQYLLAVGPKDHTPARISLAKIYALLREVADGYDDCSSSLMLLRRHRRHNRQTHSLG
jgi:hypothetical protein